MSNVDKHRHILLTLHVATEAKILAKTQQRRSARGRDLCLADCDRKTELAKWTFSDVSDADRSEARFSLVGQITVDLALPNGVSVLYDLPGIARWIEEKMFPLFSKYL